MRHQMRSVTSNVRGSMNERSELAWSRSCEVLGALAIECRWNGDVMWTVLILLLPERSRALSTGYVETSAICAVSKRARVAMARLIVMVIKERCLDSVREQAVEYL